MSASGASLSVKLLVKRAGAVRIRFAERYNMGTVKVSEKAISDAAEDYEVGKILATLTTERLEKALNDQLDWLDELRVVLNNWQKANDKVIKEIKKAGYAFPECEAEDYDVDREKSAW